MPCAEITNAIAWNKKSNGETEFPVIAYFTRHVGLGSKTTDDSVQDGVTYATGKVVAVDQPSPHLKGTLAVAKNTDQNNLMIADPQLTYDVEIFPDGTLSYLEKLKGHAIGGFPATKVQATCVNNVLLTATIGAPNAQLVGEVVSIGVALKPFVQIPQ
jgi:hypothetical protein